MKELWIDGEAERESMREIARKGECPYCGNLSELRDRRGNCLGCGARREPIEPTYPDSQYLRRPQQNIQFMVCSSSPMDYYQPTPEIEND